MADVMSDRLKAQKDLLWGMYADLRAHARHAETLRANAVNYVLVVAAAIIVFVNADDGIERTEWPMGVAVVITGLLGLAFTASYTELFQRNRRRALAFRARLDNLFFEGEHMTIDGLLNTSDSDHEATTIYRWSRRLTGSASRFWLVVPVLVIIAGGALIVGAVWAD